VRKLAWGALLAVVLGALVFGVTDRSAPTRAQRAHSLGESIMCPACGGESVTDSQAPVAKAIRTQIAQLIAAGKSDQQIRDRLVASYGERIELNPPKSGLAGLVWVLPVAALVVAVAGLVVMFRRWRAAPGVEVGPDDLDAVARARRAERP
jgi:cytochrome c-type biogenesis protein CcmH